ncbi:MAG: efflux RND transporter periplasmic adaptor subunit [Bacteroidota bacterium]
MKQCIVLLLILLTACRGGEKDHTTVKIESKPIVSADGVNIKFTDSMNLTFIKTAHISASSLTSELHFPARVAATSVASQEGAERNIILFEDPELTDNYMELIRGLITVNQVKNVNIKQKSTELDRAKDLAANGAATGKDVLEAETALAIENAHLGNERASLIEHEAILKQAGFDPDELINARPGRCWILCEIPETMLIGIAKGDECLMMFGSFPDEKFKGLIEAVGEVVDRNTRMVKVRIAVRNADSRLKAGMFANVSFDKAVKNAVTIPKQAIITVQGKTYCFVKVAPLQFERQEVKVSSLNGDRAVIASGIDGSEEVVTEGAMQLKGLSFGY